MTQELVLLADPARAQVKREAYFVESKGDDGMLRLLNSDNRC